MVGVDKQMAQYNRWFERGCPSQAAVGHDGRPMPDLHVAQPPDSRVEEDL